MATGSITTASPTVTLDALTSPTIAMKGVWSGGTVTVKVDGVELQERYTSNFEIKIDTTAAVVIILTLVGTDGRISNSVALTYNAW